jgi:hypothetical protein
MMTAEDINILKESLDISNEILNDIEESKIAFEKILFKCKKLARLQDDFDALNWFSAELSGYGDNVEIQGVTRKDLERYALQSGRYEVIEHPNTKQRERRYLVASISELETIIQTKFVEFKNTQTPQNFAPAIRKYKFKSVFSDKPSSGQQVVEKYEDVFNIIDKKRRKISQTILTYRSILSRIKNNVYNYVLNTNLRLRFQNITESIVEKLKLNVDKKLTEICPINTKRLISSCSKLSQDDPQSWFLVLKSCNDIIREFASFADPSDDKDNEEDGSEHSQGYGNYEGSLGAFIDIRANENVGKFTKSRLNALLLRLDAYKELIIKEHADGIGLSEINVCVVDTYLLIWSLIQLLEIAQDAELPDILNV